MKDKPFYYQDNRALHERKMNEAARREQKSEKKKAKKAAEAAGGAE